jgi:hypothetical protein
MQTTQTTLGSLSAAALVFALMAVTSPSLACNGNGNCENAPGQTKHDHDGPGGGGGGGVHGAPGPIAGAGLPILAIGYGVYWLVKRRRKVN